MASELVDSRDIKGLVDLDQIVGPTAFVQGYCMPWLVYTGCNTTIACTEEVHHN